MLTEARTAAARAVDLRKVYGAGDAAVDALRGVSVEFAAGEFTAIMGPSGSGKSTLLHCMAGPRHADVERQVFIGDVDITALSEKALTELRRDQVGFVFQAFNLVPDAHGEGEHHAAARHRRARRGRRVVRRVVDTVGLRDRLGHRPSELSGGQQQRVAGARALVSRPADRLRRRAHRQPRLALRRRAARVPARRRRRARADDRDGDPRRRRRRATPTASCSSPTAASSTRCASRRRTGCSTA